MCNIKRRLFVYTASVVIIGVMGCDTAPGPRDIDQSAPVVSDLEFSPLSVNLDNLAPGSIVDGIANFSLEIEITITDADADLELLYLFVLPPDSQSPTAAESIVPISSNGTVSITMNVSIPTAETGTYTVKVYASDLEGQLGNLATGSLQVDASSSPPVITDIDMPVVVTKPNEGEPPLLIPIVARVTDPEGLANILRVELIVNGSGPPILLCDDGSAGECNTDFPPSGDVLAEDGLFTVTIQLDASDAPGDNEFIFTAFDRSGLASESVTRILLVQ